MKTRTYTKEQEEMALAMRVNGLTTQLITLQEQQSAQINSLLQACAEYTEFYKKALRELRNE